MKAAIYRAYGGPEAVTVAEVPKPAPVDDEVLIAVRAASVNPLDWHFLRGEPYFLRLMAGLRKPKIEGLGVDVAGVVEAVGRNATRFRAGDEVFGTCRGAFAEYAAAPEMTIAAKPNNATFEQAAAIPVAACTALQGLRDVKRVQSGQKVLINGAAGGVGTFAVQLAKIFGAETTAVCSARNVELVRSLGADRVLDYTAVDVTKDDRRYDLILDCVGNHSLRAFRRLLEPNGVYVSIGAPTGRWLRPLPRFAGGAVMSLFGSRKVRGMLSKPSADDLAFLGELVDSGKLRVVIDRSYSLSEAAEALRYLEAGHARGKVIVSIFLN